MLLKSNFLSQTNHILKLNEEYHLCLIVNFSKKIFKHIAIIICVAIFDNSLHNT